MNSTIVALDYPEYGTAREVPGPRYHYRAVSRLGRHLRGWSPAFAETIRSAAAEVHIVHSHALWMVSGIYARRAAQRFGLPLVISPRGMLDPWSLSRSKTKKRLAAYLYENRNLRTARLIHATSDLEAVSIRNFGLRQPIAVVPNGIDISDAASACSGEILERQFPELRGKRWLLYLGRLDPKKGLDLLLGIWRQLGPRFPDWRLVVAGPDLGGFGARMVARVAADPELRMRTTFTGMLEGAEKTAALSHSELFVSPTLGENFGIAIAEALVHGTPVITTTAAPWSELVRHECGWWVEPAEGPVLGALESALRRSASELSEMGERGRRLIRSQYTWDAIAMQWMAVYRWVLAGGEPPACVQVL